MKAREKERGKYLQTTPEPVFRKKDQIGPGNKMSFISFFCQLL